MKQLSKMMLMLLVAVMGMCMQSCTEEETKIVSPPDTRTYDTELEVTKQDLVKYEVVFGDFDDTHRIFLFKNAEAAHVSHRIGSTSDARYVIFKSWSLSNGKLTFTVEKDGEKETLVYSIKKMYKKVSANEYELQIILRDEDGKYVFYATEDGSNHNYAQEWWNIITRSND